MNIRLMAHRALVSVLAAWSIGTACVIAFVVLSAIRNGMSGDLSTVFRNH